eukprot:1165395-Amphidinium_carterae.1
MTRFCVHFTCAEPSTATKLDMYHMLVNVLINSGRKQNCTNCGGVPGELQLAKPRSKHDFSSVSRVGNNDQRELRLIASQFRCRFGALVSRQVWIHTACGLAEQIKTW